MATVKERAVVRILERIPHKDVAYAFIEIEASNWNEFEKARADVVQNHPAYAFAAQVPATPKLTAMQKLKLMAAENVVEVEVAETPDSTPPAASTVVDPIDVEDGPIEVPAEEPKLSARDVARARILAKKKGA